MTINFPTRSIARWIPAFAAATGAEQCPRPPHFPSTMRRRTRDAAGEAFEETDNA
jgi:hypothetical protein